MKFCAPDIFSGVSNRFLPFNDISGNLIRAVASIKKCTSRPIVPLGGLSRAMQNLVTRLRGATFRTATTKRPGSEPKHTHH